jgi:hypothetical protein
MTPVSRLSRSLACTALLLLATGCDRGVTGPPVEDAPPSRVEATRTGGVEGTLASAETGYLVNTGPGLSGGAYRPLYGSLFHAGMFNLTESAEVFEASIWVRPIASGRVYVRIRPDDDGAPGSEVVAATSGFISAPDDIGDTSYGWEDFDFGGYGFLPDPGDYWITFEVDGDFYGALSFPAEDPLERYAVCSGCEVDGSGWGGGGRQIGIRIAGAPYLEPRLMILALVLEVENAEIEAELRRSLSANLVRARIALEVGQEFKACQELAVFVRRALRGDSPSSPAPPRRSAKSSAATFPSEISSRAWRHSFRMNHRHMDGAAQVRGDRGPRSRVFSSNPTLAPSPRPSA